MLTSKTTLILAVFTLGVSTGVVINKLSGASVDPAPSVDGLTMSGSPAAPATRLDRMEARLNEMSASLNRVDEWVLRMGSPNPIHQQSATSLGKTNKSLSDTDTNTTINAHELERMKSRIVDTLHDPTTNFARLMESQDMQALPAKQREEVMQEVAARLDSGQLRKEQFLPGYKFQSGAR